MKHSAAQHPFIFIRSNGKYFRVDFADILWVESRQNYVQVVTTQKSYVILHTMKQLEAALPPTDFCRIHRSFIISILHLEAFDNQQVYIQDKTFPMKDRYRRELMDKINILVNDTRLPKMRMELV